jgi:hypothetical protein
MAWMPIVRQMNFPRSVIVHEIEPSSMSDAIAQMSVYGEARYVIGMPDTYMPESDGEFYRQLVQTSDDINLSVFRCGEDLRGRVGQILFDDSGRVLDALDKVKDCQYEYMWGALAVNGKVIDPTLNTPSLQIMNWVREGKSVRAIKAKGRYLDIGTVQSLKKLYSEDL